MTKRTAPIQERPERKIPDDQVELIRRARSIGVSYTALMVIWAAPKSTIESICTGRRRADVMHRG